MARNGLAWRRPPHLHCVLWRSRRRSAVPPSTPPRPSSWPITRARAAISTHTPRHPFSSAVSARPGPTSQQVARRCRGGAAWWGRGSLASARAGWRKAPLRSVEHLSTFSRPRLRRCTGPGLQASRQASRCPVRPPVPYSLRCSTIDSTSTGASTVVANRKQFAGVVLCQFFFLFFAFAPPRAFWRRSRSCCCRRRLSPKAAATVSIVSLRAAL